MVASQSLPPPDEDEAPPPVFPLLPYACLAYADHCSHDYADYVDRLAHAEEPWVDEEALGLQMLSEMNRAFFALVWAPFEAAIGEPRH
jgi:hypothetical protein